MKIKVRNQKFSEKPEVQQPKNATPAESQNCIQIFGAMRCSTGLRVSLLETLKADSAIQSSRTAGVNHHVSVSKTSQASAASGQKALAWDCLNSQSVFEERAQVDSLPLGADHQSIRACDHCKTYS